jgi:iron complex outermembrane recepter protein
MARESAVPCILARVAAGLALFAIGSMASESLAVAAQSSTGTATDAAAESSNEVSAGNAVSAGNTTSAALDEIVVTARKRSEDNQQAPIAITAFNTQEIQRLGITSVADLGAQTPSLSFQQSPYDTFGSFIGMRGQQATEVIITQTPPVGMYVDDVYYPNTLTTSLENLEGIEQVEILKGPQGTLYGRNTTGGAVKITTKLPDYDAVSGDVQIGYGRFNDQTVSGSLNLPIVSDHVALGLTAQYSNLGDGYGRDIGNGVPLETNKNEGFRGTLRLDLTDQWQVVMRGEWAHAVSTQNIENLAYVVPGFSIAAASVAAQIGALTPSDYNILGGLLTTGAPPPGSTPQQIAAFFADVNKGRTALASHLCSYCRTVAYGTPAQLATFGITGVPIVPSAVLDLAGGSVVSNYQFSSDLYLKSITAFEKTVRSTASSESASPYFLVNGVGDDQNPHQFTQEIQIGGAAFDQKLKWVTGYYFYRLKGDDDAENVEIVPFEPNPIIAQSEFTDTSNSGYAQGTYALTPDVHATAGVRYTSESTKLTLGNRNAVACDVQGVPPTGAPCSADFYNAFHNTSYTAGLDWQALEHLLLYAKTSTGFRAGGTNQRSNPALPYAPETVTDYEIGAKSEWFDQRLRANIALYHSNYKDIQRTISLYESGSLVTEVQNAASARINGVELEVAARPFRPLRLSAFTAYTDPKYNSYNGLNAIGMPVNLAGNSFPNVSRWQSGVAGTYTLNDPYGPLDTTVDSSFRSTVDYVPDDHTADSAFSTTQGSYALLNARMSQEISDWNTTVSLWGKNVTNRHYFVGGNDFSTSLGYAYTIPGAPATFGIEIRKRF